MIRFVFGMFMIIFGVAGIESDTQSHIGFALCLLGFLTMAWAMRSWAKNGSDNLG